MVLLVASSPGDTATVTPLSVTTKSPDNSAEDLALPLSRLPPSPWPFGPGYEGLQFLDLADLMPENLQEPQFDQAKDSKAKEDVKKKKAPINSTLDWSVVLPHLWQWRHIVSPRGLLPWQCMPPSF